LYANIRRKTGRLLYDKVEVEMMRWLGLSKTAVSCSFIDDASIGIQAAYSIAIIPKLCRSIFDTPSHVLLLPFGYLKR
jgi:hypothetical protein